MGFERGVIFMRKGSALLLIFCALFFSTAAWAETQHAKHIREATALVLEMAKQDDAAAMGHTVRGAKGIAVFPSMIEAGFGIGEQSGEGVVMARNKNGTWSGPSFVSLVGGSFGLQIGIAKVGLVLVINNDNGMRVFTGGKSFKLGAGIDVAAGPVGRDAGMGTDSRAKASIYSYSMSEGAYIGITIKGATINVNRDANKAYWNKKTEAKAALSRPATSKMITPLIAAFKVLIQKAD